MPTHPYGVRDVEKLLHVARSTLRGLVAAGFVTPARGLRGAWRFSFQDLIGIRTAQALASAQVPRRRILACLKELRRRLPVAMPLSGLRITAVGDRVVVNEGARRWQADSGQYLLAFEGDPATGTLSVAVPPKPERGDALAWLEDAMELEAVDPEAAIRAYERVIRAEPGTVDAYINAGCLLHEAGDLRRAERAYRSGLLACGAHGALLFNLGVLLEDTGRKDDALNAYQQALAADPAFADCHYNLALLCEALDRPREAIRHMAQYRRLTGSKRP